VNKDQIDIIGLGASTVDIITLADHFPNRREAQQALAMVVQGGGPVATAMVTVSRLGGKSAMIDNIGDDWVGKHVIQEFQVEGLKTNYIEILHGHTTSVSNIVVSANNGARAIMFMPSSVPELSLSISQKSAIQSAKILRLNGRHWKACLETIDLARKWNIRISFDGGANRFRPEMKSLVPLTNICIAAKEFAEKYTGEDELSKSTELILREGPNIAVVTDGVNGSWICTEEGLSIHQPAFLFPRTIDTTGCGDSYHGAFLFGLLKGYSADKAAILASAVAAMNSQHLGGRAGIPNCAGVLSFLLSNGITLE
jgi:sulfofructose kinase